MVYPEMRTELQASDYNWNILKYRERSLFQTPRQINAEARERADRRKGQEGQPEWLLR